MTALLPAVRGKRVLDVACGSGRYARWLHANGAHVSALDFSYEMLARSDRSLARAQADMNALPLESGAVQVIVCGLAVGHVADMERALREMARVLTPHGTLVYSDFHAATRKWKRTFRAQNQTYAVQHFPRHQAEHVAALRKAGFVPETFQAVHVSAELARVDARAQDFRDRWGDTPVALVVRAQKS